MKVTLIILLILHGLIHLMGFVKGFDIVPVKQLNEPISKSFGVLWLITCLLCLLAVVLLLIKSSYWWWVGLSAILISQMLIVFFWKDAKFGTIANAIIGVLLFLV